MLPDLTYLRISLYQDAHCLIDLQGADPSDLSGEQLFRLYAAACKKRGGLVTRAHHDAHLVEACPAADAGPDRVPTVTEDVFDAR